MPRKQIQPGKEGEERLLRACCMLVSRYVELNLPEHRRGLHSVKLDQDRIYAEVRASFNDIVAKLVAEVEDTTDVLEPPSGIPVGYTNRISVMDNDAPCDVCNKVNRVAVLDYQDGECVSVECEGCAPEFK